MKFEEYIERYEGYALVGCAIMFYLAVLIMNVMMLPLFILGWVTLKFGWVK